MDFNEHDNGLMCAQPWAYSGVVEKLKNIGLRPTRQRVILAKILFEKGHRHITAEQLHKEVSAAFLRISLATVYNTLNQFVEAGLLKEIPGHSTQTFYDTRVDEHYHFLSPSKKNLIDIPIEQMQFGNLPTPPEGTEIDKIEVTIHLKKKSA